MRDLRDKFAVVVFSVLALAALNCKAQAAQPVNAAIVGGKEATKGEFPFIVSLQDYSGHFCGGTLIQKDWVLTAAHCVDSKATASSMKVVLGLHELSNMGGTETFTAKRIIVHPEYGRKLEGDFDFALIQLNKKSKFAPLALNELEIDIPKTESEAPVVTTSGWGATSEGSDVSDSLMKVNLPLVNFDLCEKAYPKQLTDEMICAGPEKGGKDSCQGDSGGPLFMTDREGERKLVGVVSWGDGCARPGKYGVYSKVSTAISWIEKEISL